MKISEKAQLLENAGKEGNIEYIKENYKSFMDEFNVLGKKISDGFAKEAGNKDTTADEPAKPMADNGFIQSVLGDLHEAAESMDCDTIEDIFKEIDGYSIPEPYAHKLDSIRQYADVFDYDAILELLDKE